ncbi:FkbM family methyltransferase [Tateyamaria sp. SN6-1]|uniref:FkbM family methyltransferase n=1 Tax=Tateyamaria sp. SN6-1 TaxID=3092148 RepID=UPI0039F54421
MPKPKKAAPEAQNEYGIYCVPEGLEKRPAAKAVLSGQVYEPDTIAFMRAHAGKGDIIHAGTFFGDFLPAISAALAPKCKIWAFEPAPENFAAAEQTIAMNKLKNVTLTQGALSNQDDTLLFKTHKSNGQALGGVSRIVDTDGDGVQKVQALMLDYAVPRDRDISILQLDVEGHEKKALLGAFHIIHRCRPILVLEYMDDARWLSRTFRGLNYKSVGTVHGNYVYAPPDRDVKL